MYIIAATMAMVMRIAKVAEILSTGLELHQGGLGARVTPGVTVKAPGAKEAGRGGRTGSGEGLTRGRT
jgi:hypothetical protein